MDPSASGHRDGGGGGIQCAGSCRGGEHASPSGLRGDELVLRAGPDG